MSEVSIAQRKHNDATDLCRDLSQALPSQTDLFNTILSQSKDRLHHVRLSVQRKRKMHDDDDHDASSPGVGHLSSDIIERDSGALKTAFVADAKGECKLATTVKLSKIPTSADWKHSAADWHQRYTDSHQTTIQLLQVMRRQSNAKQKLAQERTQLKKDLKKAKQIEKKRKTEVQPKTETDCDGSDVTRCCVCMDRARTEAFAPCLHFGVCEPCARQLESKSQSKSKGSVKCVFCKQPSKLLHLFVQ